jgi:hypothetical protein
MFGAESHIDNKFQVKTPSMPGLETPSTPNPFNGIRRAGQAKRAQNYEKFQQSQKGSLHQSVGGQAGTLSGSMRPQKENFA